MTQRTVETIIPRRGLGTKNVSFIQRNIHSYYLGIAKHPKVGRTLYSAVQKKFNGEIAKLLIYHNYEFVLPNGLGRMSIVKQKLDDISFDENGNKILGNVSINYGATVKLWVKDEDAHKKRKVILYLEDANNGFRRRFRWGKGGVMIKNNSSYKFKILRKHRLALNEAITNQYIKIDHNEI